MLYLAREKGVAPTVIPEMGRDITWRDDLKTLFKIYRLIKKENPHIIHTHTAKAGALGRSAAILYNLVICYKLQASKLLECFKKSNSNYQPPINKHTVKLIHTFHGHVFHGYFGTAKTNLFLCIEKILAMFTDKIITVSEKQREEILGFRIGDSKKVISVHLGLELKKYLTLDRYNGSLRKELSISSETKLVGIIARLVPIKNHKMFIDAISEVKVGGKQLKIKFLIIGDGELRKQLEDYSKEKGLEAHIVFLGFRRDMERIYADLDVVVLTSVNEGSPVALIEAMAAGKPVVSTDVGGVGDLFKAKRKRQNEKLRYYDQGILVNPGDSKGLAVAVEELLGDEKLRRKMGEEGKKMVYPQYDISRLLKDMKGLYREVVNGAI
jgi:glycosyltransferase involved in cell wall biosynthesis